MFVSLFVAFPVSFRYEIVPSSPFVSSNESSTNSTSSSASLRLSSFGSSRYFRLYSIVTDFLRAIIPSLFLLYLNTRIVYLVCRMKASRTGGGTAIYRLTISLIIIIGCFICCYFPDALLSLILNVGYIDESYRRRAIREITDFCITLNSATNFLIYFSISSTFRRAMFRLFQRSTKLSSPTTYEDLVQRQRLQRIPMNTFNKPI